MDSKTLSSTYYNQIKGTKINTTIGFGVNAQDSSGYSYILAMTFVSKSKDLEKATGEEVKDVPANLPKVTRAKNGEPSIDMNGQGSVDSLISQTLIKGNGAKLTDKNTVVVKYTGWLTNGKQFDSSGIAIPQSTPICSAIPAASIRLSRAGRRVWSARPSALRFCW